MYTHIIAGHKFGHGHSFPTDCVSKTNTHSHSKAYEGLTVSVARGDDVCNSNRLWYLITLASCLFQKPVNLPIGHLQSLCVCVCVCVCACVCVSVHKWGNLFRCFINVHLYMYSAYIYCVHGIGEKIQLNDLHHGRLQHRHGAQSCSLDHSAGGKKCSGWFSLTILSGGGKGCSNTAPAK